MNTDNKKPKIFGIAIGGGTMYLNYDEDTQTVYNRAENLNKHISRDKLDLFFAMAKEIGLKITEI